MDADIIDNFLQARRGLAEAERTFHDARRAVLQICPPGESRGPIHVRISRFWKLTAAAKARLSDLRKALTAEGHVELVERPAVYVLADKRVVDTADEQDAYHG